MRRIILKVLLHTCCAPCSIMCIETLRKENIEPTCFWYNPNIHPFQEYKKRKKTLIDYTNEIDVKLIIENEYGLREFIDNIYPNFDNRCGVCYNMRLFETAKYAKENGFDAFTTTLLISPYQDHDLMCMIAKAADKKYDIEFLYRDFRPYFNEGQEKAIALNLYRQNYCGCIFSEEERFSKKRRKEISNKQKEKVLQ